MEELFDLFNGDFVVDKLKEAYVRYIEEMYRDVPIKPKLRFKRYVEKVIYAIIVNDEDTLHQYVDNLHLLRDDLVESIESRQSLRLFEEGFDYHVTFIGSLNLVYVEREKVEGLEYFEFKRKET